MKDVRDNVFSFLDDWYGRLDDIIEDLKNNGFAVLNATNEFIDVSDENDKEYVLKLGGTEKTITINKIEALDESLIPIQEYYDGDEWDDDELASIYGGDTKDSQKAIADEMKELYLDEASHPKLGKRVKSLKGWKIYQGTNNYGDEVFRCFTPDEDRPAVGYEDWETDTLEQAISWIENYDLKESKKPTNESNKELARIAFEDILKPFNGTDIKYTDETEDAEFKTHSYVANIISTPQYVELIKKLIDSDKYEYDPNFNDYVKYTEYGQITIIIEDKYITIEVMYNNDEDYFDENLILIKEKNNDEKVIYKDNINIDMNVVITEDPNNSEYYNIYVDDDPTLFLQEPKSAVKKLKLTALDAVIDYYKAEHFSDTDY